MDKRTTVTIVCGLGMVWLSCMAWLSGYKQGYAEGSETAWSNARSALMEPLPALKVESVELSSNSNP